VAVVVLCVAQFVVVLDGLAVSVALNAIGADLDLRVTDLSWILQAYILTYGGFLAVGGRAGDLFGHRRLLIAGLLGFGLASLLAASATGLPVLLAARAAQGVGAALITPAALAILVNGRDEQDKARATALWSVIGGTGVVAGAVIGGVVTSAIGWRWLFVLNVPLMLVAALLVPMTVPRSQPDRSHRLDLPGAVALVAAVTFVLYGLPDEKGLHSFGSLKIVSVLVGVVLLGWFAWRQRRLRDPLIPGHVLASRKRRAASIGVVALNGGFACILVFGSMQLQNLWNYDPLGAGLGLVPLAALTALAGAIAERLVRHYYRTPVAVAGLVLMFLGFIVLALSPMGEGYFVSFLPGSIMLGAGISAAYVPLTLMAVGTVSERNRGVAVGVYQTFGQVGSAVVLGAVSAGAVLLQTGGSQISGFGGVLRAAYVLISIVLCLGSVLTWLVSNPPRTRD
jgi:MFS family permease